MPVHEYTLALVLMWLVVTAAAYVSQFLFHSRTQRTLFTFAGFVPFMLLNWFGLLNIWPLSSPLPDIGSVANAIAYSGLVTAAGVLFILRFTKNKHQGHNHDPR